MNDERGEIPQEAVGEGLEVDKNLKFQETIKSPEYQAKLEKVLSEVHRFAARVKELAAGKPTDAEVAQLRKGYFDLSDLALKEHDSLPNDATNEAQHSVMGVDGSFMATVRIKMFEDLGDGDYSGQTPARKLFEIVNPGWGWGLYDETIKEKRIRLANGPKSIGKDLFILVMDYSSSEEVKSTFLSNLQDNYHRFVQFAQGLGMNEAEIRNKAREVALASLKDRGGSIDFQQRMTKSIDELMEKLV
ncbi:MAG: hypothetical protein AAB948_03410 [Patescibacteria group bacterium]